MKFDISPHFTLAELTVTKSGLPNTPPLDACYALRTLCVAVAEPWRVRIGCPIEVTSGYRSGAVNLWAGGSEDSDHMRGAALDGRPIPCTERAMRTAWGALVAMVAQGFPIDQAILYVRSEGEGWFHISCTHRRVPRGELLVSPREGDRLIPWLDWQRKDGRVVRT